MPPLLRLALLPLTASLLIAAPAIDYHDLGMQLWSLRAQMKQSEKAGLDLAQMSGVKEVETAGTGTLSVEQFSQELQSRGLKAVAAHIGYDAWKRDAAAAIRDAKALGVTYVICPMLPHKEGPVTAALARQYAAEFNTWGQACKAAGLQFGYHPHGIEFAPAGDGSKDLVFDILVRETKPELVCYEMDVFWVQHAGQNPTTLLKKYPDRWRLLHVKDMRKGAATGFTTGSAPATDNVAVGQGQLDWKSILKTAQNVGVQHYFLEDETPAPLENIPVSLSYLRGLKL